MRYPKKADIEKGLKAVVEFLVLTCKASDGNDYGTGRPSYNISTVCGPMRVTPFFDPRSTPWIACRFDDVEAAAKHFNVPKEYQWGHQLNHHSGKWNFHGHTEPQALVEHFISKVTPLLP